jgi:hypothetical protein
MKRNEEKEAAERQKVADEQKKQGENVSGASDRQERHLLTVRNDSLQHDEIDAHGEKSSYGKVL